MYREITQLLEDSISEVATVPSQLFSETIAFEVIVLLMTYAIYNKEYITEEAVAASLELRNALRHKNNYGDSYTVVVKLYRLIIEGKFWR